MFILISSPTYRCGTTFVQRLLNTTNECMIYGENNALLPALYNILSQVSQAKTKSESQWHLFKQNKNCWQANMMPSMSHTMNSVIQFLFTMYGTAGYSKYGIKVLACMPHHVDMFSHLFGGELKIIYCLRQFENAYASYQEMYNWMTKQELEVLYNQSVPVSKIDSSCLMTVNYDEIDHSKCKEILEFVDCQYDSTIVDEVLSLKLREEPNYVRK